MALATGFQIQTATLTKARRWRVRLRREMRQSLIGRFLRPSVVLCMCRMFSGVFDWYHKTVVRTPNHYLQQLFAVNKGDRYLKNESEFHLSPSAQTDPLLSG